LCAAAVSTAAIAAKPTTRNRAEIPAEYRWDFSAIYPSWAAWEAGMKEMDARIDAFAKLQGTLAQGPEALLKAYQSFDEIGKLQYRLYRYPAAAARRRHARPGRRRPIPAHERGVRQVRHRVGVVHARADHGPGRRRRRRGSAQTPALAPYRFPILDAYRRKAHVLDDKGERLLSLASQFNDAPRTIYQELSTSDIKFPTLRLGDGSEVVLSPATTRAAREEPQPGRARQGGGSARRHLRRDGAHLRRDLQRHAPARLVPRPVAQLRDHARRRARRQRDPARRRRDADRGDARRLGAVPALRAPAPEAARPAELPPVRRVPADLPQRQDLSVRAGARPRAGLDRAARRGLRAEVQALRLGRPDRRLRERGQAHRAYSAGVYGVGPYLLMNYNDTLDAAFTLAHEAGHAMHTVLSYESQPFVTADYTIFVAEVASTTNERLLLEQLLKQTSDPKERFLLLQHAVDSIVGTFFTQVLFADFELRAHRLVEQGQPLTTEVLNDLYAGLLKEYWGDALTVDDFYQWTWARIPHFFNSPYYVYQYATCFASSAQLYDAMTTGVPESRKAATERYLRLLKSGGNDHPMAQLKEAGVDLTQRATIQAVVDQMNLLVSQMESEAAKIR
jgi:oligoendopeptidase F